MLSRLWREDEGILTFEWVLLLTVLVIGVVVGLTAVRDAMNVELANVAAAMVSLNQGYAIADAGNIRVGRNNADVAGLVYCSPGARTSASSFQSTNKFTAVAGAEMGLQVVGPCP
jgi:hypothetical protein